MFSSKINVFRNTKECRLEKIPSQITHATISQVAARAGVSAMTVSRALRDPARVSIKTRDRISKAVEEIGYIPNALAGRLRLSGTSNIVAVILPSLHNSLFSRTIQGLSDGLLGHGLNLMLGDNRYSRSIEQDLVESFMEQRPAGFVLHETTHTAKTNRMLKLSRVPVVEIGDLVSRPIDAVVSYSNKLAAKALTMYLIEKGYRRIGFVSVPFDNNRRALQRRDGYLEALNASRITPKKELILECSPGFSGGVRGIEILMGKKVGVDAIFFAGDVFGIGALLECQRRGLRVPEGVALASFDDYDISGQLTPHLTCLDIPRHRIGLEAARVIVSRSKGGCTTRERVNVGFNVMVNGTS